MADHLENHPEGCTLREIDAACDVGSASKVLSDMTRRGGLGYGIRKGWRHVPGPAGKAPRRRRVYILTSRPAPAGQLSLDLA